MVSEVLIKIRYKEVVIAYFEVLIRYLCGGIEENHDTVFDGGRSL
jgi:hypothetical protein